MTVLKFPDPKREPSNSPPMYCGVCGKDRTIPNNAAITPCDCGSTMRVTSGLLGKVFPSTDSPLETK